MTEQREGAALEACLAARREEWVRAAARIVLDSALAEDVVQDTLAALLRVDLTAVANLEAYVFRAVQVNALKCRARRRMHLSLDADPALADARPDERDGAEAGPEIDPATLEIALDGLPETQRTVIRMRYYLDRSFREIGAALSISTNTAASRCRYALAALRKALQKKSR
jgi:RNA polymerase sigma-70 factor, ECF subfamily